MSTITAPRRAEASGGESIGFETSTRSQAESLQVRLAEFGPSLVRRNGNWIVELTPDRHVTTRLISVSEAVGDWLADNRLASVDVHFGPRRFTLLHSADAVGSHTVEFLLQRVIQLQTALDSRVIIEQAKGILAGSLRVELEEAFDLLRRAARRTGRQLHELAADIVNSDELPVEIKHTLESWRRDD